MTIVAWTQVPGVFGPVSMAQSMALALAMEVLVLTLVSGDKDLTSTENPQMFLGLRNRKLNF